MAASVHFHAFFLPVLHTIFFLSHWLLSHVTIAETMDSDERGIYRSDYYQFLERIFVELLFSSSVPYRLSYGARHQGLRLVGKGCIVDESKYAISWLRIRGKHNLYSGEVFSVSVNFVNASIHAKTNFCKLQKASNKKGNMDLTNIQREVTLVCSEPLNMGRYVILLKKEVETSLV